MTIGNETTLPAPNGSDENLEQNQQQTAAPAADATVAPEFVDPDDVELAEARAAVKAEEAGGAGGGEGGADGAPAAQQQDPAKAAAAQADPAGDVKIPKARLDEEIGKRSKAEQDAAYWRGVAEARAQAAAPAQAAQQQQQPLQKTPAEQIADLRVEKAAIAKKFDDGEISYADATAAQDAIDDKVFAIRELSFKSSIPQPQAQAQSGDDGLVLEERTVALEQAHPWVTVFDQLASKTGDESDWDWLAAKAKSGLAAEGVELKNDTRSKLMLRTRISELADQYGPALIGERAKTAGIAIPGQKTPQGQQQQQQPGPGLSATAKARQEALAKAANAPPDLNSMTGSSAEDLGAPSDARIEAMSEDEIAALPKATRQRLMGLTP
jgi:hypothetical protein